MKKIIMAFSCLMTMAISFTSCGSTYVVTANYDVCYPDGSKTCEGTITVRSSCYPTVGCYSHGGTNYVSVLKDDASIYNKSYAIIISSTAPIRLNSFSIKETKSKNVKVTNDNMYMLK